MDAATLGHMRILVVDDEPDSIEVVKIVLSTTGAQIMDANDGRQGFETYIRECPDIVLTDLSMPDTDGWQLLEKIRASEYDEKRTPVIALTAHAMAGDKEKVIDAGFDGYLSKPLKMFTFLDDLKHWLEKI